MSEPAFHSAVVVVMGISGLLWLLAAVRAKETWSGRRRASVGGGMFVVFLIECLQAFPEVGHASAAELFGFLGCFLGCAGGAWQFITGLDQARQRPPQAA